MAPIKNINFEFKFFLLPLVIVAMTVFLNGGKADGSLFKFLVHVFFQTVLIYGGVAVFRSWVSIRFTLALFMVVSFFIQVAYGAPLSISVVMSLLNSSPDETVSFIGEYSFLFFSSFVLLFGLTFFKVPDLNYLKLPCLIFGLSYLLVPSLVQAHSLFLSPNYDHYIKTGLARGHSRFFSSFEYVLQDMSWRFPPLSSIRGLTDTLSFMSGSSDLTSTWTDVSSDDVPKILVIGLGESLRADNLGIYGYYRDTTPNLSRLSGDLSIYQNAYAAGTNTWSSVPAALTKSGVRPDMSKSIINLAKDAGYETFWLSNQARYSQWDYSVSSIASQSGHVYFPSDDTAGTDYDSILVERLQDTLASVDGSGSYLIVLNFYGSHMNFVDRYPPEYSVFKGGGDLLDSYDNSVLYTDFIQSEVIRVVGKHGGKYIFFSDHGLGDPDGDIPLKHDVRDRPSIGSIKVPFFTYPREKLSVQTGGVVSLYNFECIFSEWAGISAEELRGEYCDNALNSNMVRFVDSNLSLHEVKQLGDVD